MEAPPHPINAGEGGGGDLVPNEVREGGTSGWNKIYHFKQK